MYLNVGMRIDTARYVGIQTIYRPHILSFRFLTNFLKNSTRFARVARVKGHPSPYQCQQAGSHAKNDGQKPRSGHLRTWMKIRNNEKAPELVGGWTNPSEKYTRQIGSFPQGENKQCLSCHRLDEHLYTVWAYPFLSLGVRNWEPPNPPSHFWLSCNFYEVWRPIE